MKTRIAPLLLLLLFATATPAQVAINTDGAAPDNSAILDVKSTTKGALLPRMTLAQISAITSPADGLQVFCTTDGKIYIFVAITGKWKEVAYGAGTIDPPFVCGSSILVNHTAGTVAPVSKTVTYGTVTNIPGELSKCWITGNLGADHQATFRSDATEASAGWYWQFNRKQGYKNDGSSPTPAWTITSINEDSDWIPANDPCALELGSGWRIPTRTEWENVDEADWWYNWNDPWSSDLKLHAAGSLNSADGSLVSRGSNGNYWSSSQPFPEIGYALFFDEGHCYSSTYFKPNGYTLRCVKD
jgi:hypothetical protein